MFIRQDVGTIAVSLTLCFAATILSSATAHCAEQQAELATSELTCEYAANPLGVDTPQPRFGWVLKSDWRAQLQSAYRVLVATSEKQLQANVGDKWDSGKVASDQSVNVDYRGKALASGEKCYWKVRVWDKEGKVSAWSKPATFEMGLLDQSDWKGQWIGVKPPGPPAEYLDAEKPGQINVALAAKPSTSFVSGHETLDAINDGFKPANSKDKRYGAYGNYPKKGTQWIQCQWPKPVNVDSVDVYWFSDKGGVRLPKTARLLYWDGKAFVPVKNPVGLGVEGNKYNTTTFEEIITSKLKLEFDSLETASTGILEFKVYDAGKSPQFPPTNKVNRFVTLANAAVAPSPLLRKEFAVTKKVRQARVHISGLGWSELYINGKKVSDDVLSPNLTDYSQEVLYRTYDVTSFLKSGANAVGMMLGNGWYSATSIQPWVKGGPWGDGPRAILQMTVTYDDGTEKLYVTDETWKASTGAIGSNQLVAGEAYDARLVKPDWNTAAYDDRQWSNAAVRPAPEGKLRSQLVPSMKVQDTFRPIKMTKHADGGWVFEFDRFFSGWVLLKTKGKAGAKITIHYESIPAGWTTEGEKDTYILKGDPEGETYEPRFTIHSVRFVRVEGLEGKPTLDTLQGREVYSDVDMHGSFNCSNDLLNQIHGNIQQTLKVAFKGFVLDGLHREPIFYNEPASYFGTLSARKRMPNMWTEVARGIPLAGSDDGDLSDIVPRLPGMKRKSDVSQNAAYPMLLWYLYQCHGDKGLVEHHCDRVKAWVDFIGRELAEDNHIVTKGFLGEHMLPGREVGQWEFISKETPKDFIWTCFYYHNTRTLANMFQVLGNNKQEKHYRKLAQEIRAVINKKWLDPKTGHYATKSQTSEIIALALDIVPEANKQQLIKNIAHTITEADDGKLRVGHIGLPGFMESLVENGLGQVVYDAVNHTEFPGWGYMVDQGATTVWEGWSLVTKVKEWNDNLYHAEESMTMLAGVGRLFYESIAGIQEPPYYGTAKFGLGYRHFHIKPHPLGDLKHAEASIKTVRGIVSSSWKRTKDSFVLEIEIPVNSTAKVSVPSIGLKNAVVTEGGAAVWKDGAYVKGVAGIDAGIQEAEYYTFDVGSGRYKFTVTSRAQTPVERVETEQQLVAITFDDGPHAVNTPKLLELFKKNDAKATFFVVGRGVGKHPELAKRMLAEGHELGNHTTTHADLAKLGDLEKVRKEIEDTQRILKETIGKPALVFRAPFLSHDENVWTVLKDMPSINASRLTTDWSGDCTPQSIFDQATKDTKAGDIILMHSWQNKTIEAMPGIIKALQAKGLKLVTVSELLAAAAPKSDGYYGKMKVAPKVEVKARPFDLNQVRLTGGYSNHAQDVNRRYLLSLDGDRLLHNFRVTAGLGSKAKPLAGWESPTCGLRGHFVGHYLSACSQMFASTGDVKLKNRAEQIVAELAKCQTALGTGYLSAFPVKAFDILEEKCDSGVWAPYYTIHKIMAGLLDAHILCGDKQALVMLEKMAGYFKKRMDALPAETIEKMLRCDKCNPANEYGGMSDVLHDLYEVTGKPQHLELAHLFDRDCFLGPLMKGKDNLTNLHCNTHIPIVLGAARHYELTGMKDYRRAVEFFWERVALMRSYATGNCSGPAANPNRGTSGKSEHWGLADKLAQTLTGGEGESCVGHNMLKVTGKLFSWTADPKYADFAERLYFNTVLNQQNPTSGMFTYHQPLGSPQKKRFGRSNETFTCCYGTGVEAFSELAKDIYFHDSSAIWVNLYIASELNWKDKGLRLEQTAKFPESETAHFVFHLDKPTEMTVNLRIPYWVRTEGSVKINGKQQKHNVMKAGSFYSLKHKWNNGDRLELSLPMGLHLHPMPDDKNLSALMFGPLVLAAQTNGKLTFNGTPTQLLASVKPVKDKPLTFILKSEGESITFKPLYSIRDESYGVYVRTARF